MPRATLRIGQLRVRYLKGALEAREGVIRPRVFRAAPADFADYLLLRKEVGYNVGRSETGLAIVDKIPRQRVQDMPDQVSAQEHRTACQALDHTPAGAKAKDLLFRYLIDPQRETAERYGFFDFFTFNPHGIDKDLALGKGVRFSTLRWRIYRGYPNGNIKLGYPGERFLWTICLHPVTPYPNDDIALGQYLSIINDPEWFIQQANITEVGTMKTITFERMYQEREAPKPMVIPHRATREEAYASR